MVSPQVGPREIILGCETVPPPPSCPPSACSRVAIAHRLPTNCQFRLDTAAGRDLPRMISAHNCALISGSKERRLTGSQRLHSPSKVWEIWFSLPQPIVALTNAINQ